MNGFVISAGAYILPLTSNLAIRTGQKIGVVKVDMGDTACQVPLIPDYIRKIEARGALGKEKDRPLLTHIGTLFVRSWVQQTNSLSV
jgi:hypothetical protein